MKFENEVYDDNYGHSSSQPVIKPESTKSSQKGRGFKFGIAALLIIVVIIIIAVVIVQTKEKKEKTKTLVSSKNGTAPQPSLLKDGPTPSTTSTTTGVPHTLLDITERIRLVGGNSSSQGRLEVYYRGSWGSVCDDGFDFVDATIACKTLGFGMGTEVEKAYFGEGQGMIWLDDLKCANDDQHFFECAHSGWGVNDCTHAEDVGVICQMPSELKGTLRLTDADSPFAGRLEVNIGGIWGSICDDWINDTVAEIFCKTLGMPPENGFKPQAFGGAFFGQAGRDVPIWYDDVLCPFQHMGISGCSMYKKHNCRHHEDVSLICREEAKVKWEVRLVDSPQKGLGHVQVRSGLHDTWGYICDDYWDTFSAVLACKDLGFGDRAVAHIGSYFHNITNTTLSNSDVNFSLDDVRCDETMTSLRHCSHLPWGKHNCQSNEIAGVTCIGKTEETLRLVGSKESSGRVEIFYKNQWGTICNDQFDNRDAVVICRMLGYVTGIALYGIQRGTGPIWLDDLKCDSSENSIFDCSHNGWGVHDCDHSEDIGVSCHNLDQISSPFLYFADSGRRNIFQMSVTGGAHIPVGHTAFFVRPTAITYDPLRNYLYWTNNNQNGRPHRNLGRLSLTDYGISMLMLPPDTKSEGLALDYISNLLYLTDGTNNAIRVVDFKSKTNKTLMTTGYQIPMSIVIDPEEGWMYWTEKPQSRIMKAKMDGTEKTVLVEDNPQALALDKPAGRLIYSTDSLYDTIKSVSLDGTNRIIHFRSRERFSFQGIAVDDQYFYLTTLKHRYIYRLLKTAVGATSLESIGEWIPGLNTTYSYLKGLVLVGSSYQKTGTNACASNNGGCSHFCFAVPGGRVCACPDGMELQGSLCHGVDPVNQTSSSSPLHHVVKRSASSDGEVTTTFYLVGGRTASEGRVEMSIGGVRGRVCADEFNSTSNSTSATEICDFFGYDYGIADGDGFFGKGDGRAFIRNCKPQDGTNNYERCLKSDCGSSHDAGVACFTDLISTISLSGDSLSRHRGIVSIKDVFSGNGLTGPLCATDNVGKIEAEVICEMMGFLTGQIDVSDGLDFTTWSSNVSWNISGCGIEAMSLYDCGLRKIQSSNCPQNKVVVVKCSNDEPTADLMKCTFEGNHRLGRKKCPMRNINSKYRFSSGRPSRAGPQVTGPCFDHTNEASYDGVFLTIDSMINAPFESPAILESKQFYTEEDACLSFHYHMRGIDDFYLKVYANYTQDDINQTVSILDVSGSQGDIWREHRVTLTPGKFSVVFEASSSSISGDVSLDDILLQPGHCVVNISEYSCTFEREPCHITSKSCNFGWRVNNYVDHTLETRLGHGMKLDGGGRNSASYFTLPLMNITSFAHLKFYYFTSSRRPQFDLVAKARFFNGTVVSLWKSHKSSGLGQWIFAEALLPTGVLQIEFSGDVRSRITQVVVDDITITSIKQPFHYERVQCDFDNGNMCNLNNLMNDEGDWEVRTLTSVSSASFKPCADYVGNQDGGLLYASLQSLSVDLQSLRKHRRISLDIPVIYSHNGSCLSFNMYMPHADDSFLLVNTSLAPIWQIYGDRTRTWRKVLIPLIFGLHRATLSLEALPPRGNRAVRISSTLGREEAQAAIDGLEIRPGSCWEANVKAQSLDCTFDDGSFCSWVKSCPTDSGVQWSLGTAAIQQSEEVPANDGAFAYVKDNQPGLHSLYTTLLNPSLYYEQCLTFKYFMRGGVSLRILRSSVSGRNVVMWSQSRTTKNWTTARLNINENWRSDEVDYNFNIVAESETANKDFFVAVDSISVIEGACPIVIDGIELQDGQDRYSGRLRIDMHGLWHGVCYNSRQLPRLKRLAETACRELGHWPLTFEVEVVSTNAAHSNIFLPGVFNCSDEAANVKSCAYKSATGKRNCHEVEITCHTEQRVFRLFGGPTSREGYLEIYSKNKFVKVAGLIKPAVICSYLFRSENGLRVSMTFSRAMDQGNVMLHVDCNNTANVHDCIVKPIMQRNDRFVWLSCLSTKAPETTPPLMSPGCDFEQGHMCGYLNDYTGDQDWLVVQKSQQRAPETGPDFPSRLRSITHDTFLLFEASTPSKTGFTARISTPDFDSTNKCLRFVYNIRGIGGTVLNVLQSTNSDTRSLGTYNQISDSGYWKVAVLRLQPSSESRVTFEAVRGIHYRGDVAIDDVEISDDCREACPGDSFRCSDGTCIRPVKICDNVKDCNGTISEEVGCSCKSEDDFQCANGVCLPGVSKCDGIPACDDFSDEKDCECQPGEFQCPNGACVLQHLVCDRRNHCGDWSDEKQSLCSDCDNGGFLCPGSDEGFCIERSKKCDKWKDCHQTGEDEKDCVSCDFNDRTTCSLTIDSQTSDSGYNNAPDGYAIHSNLTNDYFYWTSYDTEIALPPIETTSCLGFRIMNDHMTNFTIYEEIFQTSKEIEIPVGSWTTVQVTLDVVIPGDNKFIIKLYNASLDDVTLSPRACRQEIEEDKITCGFSNGEMCGFTSMGWKVTNNDWKNRQIRLTEGTPSRGRLEILYGDIWGTVCEVSFWNEDAHVACKTLGFANGRRDRKYGPSAGPVLWTRTYCDYIDVDFLKCSHRTRDNFRCQRTENIHVGVSCSGKVNGTDGEDTSYMIADQEDKQTTSLLYRKVSGMKCMQFKYRLTKGAFLMAGGLDTRQKTPFTSPFFGESGTTIVSLPLTGSDWETAEVSLETVAEYVFIIASKMENSTAALDNITINSNPCSNPPGACQGDFLPCKFIKQCFPRSEKCNGLAWCLDNSDEFNCASDTYKDFNNGNLGGGKLSGNLQWKVISGNTPTNGTGPLMSRDHLPHLSLLDLEGIPVGNVRALELSPPGVRNGRYIYAEMSGGQPGDTAILSYTTTAKCLRFHYSAVGQEDASLTVTVNGNNIWTIQATQISLISSKGILSQSGWTFVQINLTDSSSDVGFIAARGHNNLGDFALDDIVLLDISCPDPAPCPPGKFSCGDGSCIDPNLKCDGINNCGFSTDESMQLCRWAPSQVTPMDQYSTTLSPLEKWTTTQPDDSMRSSSQMCRPDQFTCKNSRCINLKNRCDFWDDCEDGSDEESCQSKDCDGVLCDTGYCVRKHLLGRGDVYCPNALDRRIENLQQGCPSFSCDGFCLPWSSYCDGFTNCRNKEDENDYCRCRGDQLTCNPYGNYGEECLPIENYCDGVAQCRDGADEPEKCDCFEEIHFRCGSGECIKKSQRCDLKIQCVDASDELGCPCAIDQFQCSNGLCIDNSRFCDRIDHCIDGSDEPANCSSWSQQYECGDRPILIEKQCDGISDCASYADELSCDVCKEKQCTDGTCIAERLICNTYEQCNLGGDEDYCKCNIDEFSCDNGACIPDYQRCDSIYQCSDFSDERGCECRGDLVKCNSTGNCISKSFLCDGFPDCYQKEDERNCQMVPQSVHNCQDGQILCNNTCIPENAPCKRSKECENYIEINNDIGCECGKRLIDYNNNNKIMNDSITSVHSWPWHVDILYRGNSMCSGILIDKDWILTASLCVGPHNTPDDYRFMLGSNNRFESSPQKVFAYPSAFQLHPTVDKNEFLNVALFRIGSKLTMSDHISPICLPKKGKAHYLTSTNICFTVGWTTSSDGYKKAQIKTDYLKEQRISRDSCTTDGQMLSCNVTLNNPYTSQECLSEAGGPLMCLQADGRWALQGISSFHDCEKGLYKFTGASAFTDWISAVVNRNL